MKRRLLDFSGTVYPLSQAANVCARLFLATTSTSRKSNSRSFEYLATNESARCVAPKPMPEEVWTKLCEQYGEHQNRVLAGHALLVDLCGEEPTIESVPIDYEPREV
jgi:hypothetical protein